MVILSLVLFNFFPDRINEGECNMTQLPRAYMGGQQADVTCM